MSDPIHGMTKTEKRRFERDRVCQRLFEHVRGTYAEGVSDKTIEAGLRFWARCDGSVAPNVLVEWWRSNRDG